MSLPPGRKRFFLWIRIKSLITKNFLQHFCCRKPADLNNKIGILDFFNVSFNFILCHSFRSSLCRCHFSRPIIESIRLRKMQKYALMTQRTDRNVKRAMLKLFPPAEIETRLLCLIEIRNSHSVDISSFIVNLTKKKKKTVVQETAITTSTMFQKINYGKLGIASVLLILISSLLGFVLVPTFLRSQLKKVTFRAETRKLF